MLFFHFGPRDDSPSHRRGRSFFTVAHHAQYGEEPPIIQDISAVFRKLDSTLGASPQSVGLVLKESEALRSLIEKYPGYEDRLRMISRELGRSRIVDHNVSLPIWMGRQKDAPDQGSYAVQIEIIPISTE